MPTKRILAVGLNYLGDGLFTTPALGLLRQAYPYANIDLLLGERAHSILEGATGADRLILRPSKGSVARAVWFGVLLRRERYDAVILLQSILSSAVSAWAAGVPLRAGFAQASCGPFLTHAVAPRAEDEHAVDAYLRLIREVAAADSVPLNRAHSGSLRISLSADDIGFAERFLRDHEALPPIVGLIVGATRPQKRWPEAYFAQLADRLWQTRNAVCVLLGGPEEQASAQQILATARVAPLISAVGQTTSKQLAAIVDRLSVVVSGDTGPLHIATAMGTPVVALFGSTRPSETGPWPVPNGVSGVRSRSSVVLYDDLPCSPCRKSPICGGRHTCMANLNPERVLDAVLCQLTADSTVSGAPRRTPLSVVAGSDVGANRP